MAGVIRLVQPREIDAPSTGGLSGHSFCLLLSFGLRIRYRDLTSAVYRRFAKWPLLRRFVGLAAAYAVALASVIASCSAVRAAVTDATASGIVICRPTLLGQSTPLGQTGLASDCSIGCLMQLGAVPPPPTTAVAAPHGSGQLLALSPIIGLSSGRANGSYRSRAPPQTV
jgi:hypothetical protein